MSDPFAQPQKLLNWAYGQHSTGLQIARDFHSGVGHRLVTEEDPSTGWQVQKLVVDGAMPPAVEENVTNCLNNLRNSFDQTLFAACKAINKPLRSAHYPWATHPTDLEARLLNKKTGEETIPSEFWDLIRAQEPYPASEAHEGGNTLIRAIATLANRKHTVGLEMTATVDHIRIGKMTVNAQSVIWTGLPMPPRVVAYKDGVELVRWFGGEGPEAGYEYSVNMDVGFDESAPSELRLIPAFPALAEFGQYAQDCLDGFKRRVAELGF